MLNTQSQFGFGANAQPSTIGFGGGLALGLEQFQQDVRGLVPLVELPAALEHHRH